MNKELYMLNFFFLMIMLLILFILSFNIMKFNPIIVIMNLLIFSMMICLNLSLWKSNYLYSIMLFLIMISGLLIIFLYFSSLISNDQVKFNLNWTLILSLIINIIMFILFNFKIKSLNFFLMKFNFMETNTIMKFNEMSFQNILNLYEYPMNNFTISSMFYLLISLFTIIKMCSMKYLSLRKIS